MKSCQNPISCFFICTCHGYLWKLYQLFLVSTFNMTNRDTPVQILAHNSLNKYGIQGKEQVRNFLLTLLVRRNAALGYDATAPVG